MEHFYCHWNQNRLEEEDVKALGRNLAFYESFPHTEFFCREEHTRMSKYTT
jgi:hypothetical protein